MEGVETTTESATASPPLLSEEELRVLEVYDRLEELQLEIALLKAQGVLSQGKSDNGPFVTCSHICQMSHMNTRMYLKRTLKLLSKSS